MIHEDKNERVVFCIPTITRPYAVLLDSIEVAVPVIEARGWDTQMVCHVGSPYISNARSTMLRQALDAKADIIIFLDHDLSFPPGALLRLIETEGDVVAGTYRFKKEPEEYMATIHTFGNGIPQLRADGCIRADRVPAGFLKVTKAAVQQFMRAYPELLYGEPDSYSIDLFNHGAWKGVWWGEDYAFSRRWGECGGEIWLIPDLDLTHHSADQAYPGNFDKFLRRQPGGIDDPNRESYESLLPAKPLKECS